MKRQYIVVDPLARKAKSLASMDLEVGYGDALRDFHVYPPSPALLRSRLKIANNSLG